MPHPSVAYRVVVTAWCLCVGLTLPHTAPAQDCLNYSEYLHWSNSVETPGMSQAFALDRDLGYVANGSEDGDGGSISILDVTTLHEPRILSTLFTPGSALDIDAEAGLICIADGSDGLTLVEAADPANPSIIGRLQSIGFVSCVALAGSVALVGSDTALYTVDVSSPATPVILDQIAGPGCAHIVIEGTLAYVSSDCCGFGIYDLGNPGDLRLLGSFDATSYMTDLAVSLPYVYLAGSMYGFGVIDVSNPTAPVQVAWLPGPEYAQGVDARGGRAYVVNGWGVTVYDIENPTAPAVLGGLPVMEARAVTLAGDYAFLPSNYSGVQIVDIRHDWPAEPLGEMAPVGQTNDVAAYGRFAYQAEGTAGLAVVDLADPAHPVVVGTASLPNSNSARKIAAEGSRVCINDAVRQVHTFDVSEPSQPVFLCSTLLPEYPYEPVLAGGWAFIPCGSHGLVLIDVNDSHPCTGMWIYDTPGWAADVQVQGHLAYVVDSYSLLILDVAYPSTPQLVGQWNHPADEISVEGNYACLSNGYGGLFLLDVRDPANPVQVAECDTPGYTQAVTLSWPYVYSANEVGGLVIHRVDSGDFTFAGSFDLPRNAGTVVRAGDVILVPQWDRGLLVLLPQCVDAAAVPDRAWKDAAVSLRAQNPCSAPGPMRLELRRSAGVSLSIFDASGRRVTKLADGHYPAGTSKILWNGKDDRGLAVKPGVYFVSCRTTEGTASAKLTLVR